MKHIKRRIFGLFLIILLSIIFTPTHAFAGTAKYGVKIGNEEDGYQLCKNLIALSPNGDIMVKAKSICKELDLAYTYNSRTKKITISNKSYMKMVFTRNSKNYVIYYYSDKTGVKKTAAYQCYYDNKSDSNVICLAALKNMVGYQYYKLPQKDYYAKQGYTGIIYFNSYSNVGTSKKIMITDNLADQIVANEISKDMSDVAKIKALCDYMNLNCEYDYTLSNYTAYDILTKGKGVCQAYAEAFHLLATKAGIKDYVVKGTATDGITVEGHAWNIVKLGKDYYHVDTTWNSERNHSILLSDKEISESHFWDKNNFPACKKGLLINRSYIETMVGDYFYYSDIDYDNNKFKLLKTKYDGTNKSLLLELTYQGDECFHYFRDNYFYYAKQGDNTSFYKFNLLTKELEEILTDISIEMGEFSVYNDYIYIHYRNRIIRINILTKEQQVLYKFIDDKAVYSVEGMDYMLVDSKGISFTVFRYADSYRIREKYHINLDGTNLTLVESVKRN